MIYQWFRKDRDRVDLEHGFYIETTGPIESAEDIYKINWLIADTFAPNDTNTDTFFSKEDKVVEIGPRIQIETPFSSNAVSICHNIGITNVTRFEHSRRYRVDRKDKEAKRKLPFDKMTEQFYENGIETFETAAEPDPIEFVDFMNGGMPAFERAIKKEELGFDEQDKVFNFRLFKEIFKRNPTTVELKKLNNDNSEHSRHWCFNGIWEIDGIAMPDSLMDLIKRTLKSAGDNDSTLAAFDDNSGINEGFDTTIILPRLPGEPSSFTFASRRIHITNTAETHNHPTYVSPFAGAQTGVGGRIRDNVAVRRGAIIGFGVAGYFVGGLFIPGYHIPGEYHGRNRPSTYSSPLEQLIYGSNGAASYANEIGEPTIGGWCRSFSQIVDGEWREPRKPVLYSGGLGMIFDMHLQKQIPETGMLLVRLGGRVYPVGVNGGSASSMENQASASLDFNSVQRGNPAEENAVNRVFRTIVESVEGIIVKDTDMGAGGIGNAFTELSSPHGGRIDLNALSLGDKTMTNVQKTIAETQESYAIVIRREKRAELEAHCKREGVCCDVIGEITGDGKIVMIDSKDGSTVVDLDLNKILEDLPQKTFKSTRKAKNLKPLDFSGLKLDEAIEKVFKQLAVGSKGFLVHKKDRAVTGLIARQQCCGIAQIPIADNGIGMFSHTDYVGMAEAIGENPNRILIDPKAGVRMVIGEALTNLSSVRIRDLRKIRCRANWIWPAKMPHEGALMYDAVSAMTDFMMKLGLGDMPVNILPTGGKDSLTPVATVGGEKVKAPGTLIILADAAVPDVRKHVTPDIKYPGQSYLYLIDLGMGKNRLGGSALAQAYEQLGNESPDVDDIETLKRTLHAMQELVDRDLVAAIHDRSDGGVFTTVAEMCMASRCGFSLYTDTREQAHEELFSEELGIVLEVTGGEDLVEDTLARYGVPCKMIGITQEDNFCDITCEGESLYSTTIEQLRTMWEETSFQLECLQMDPECAKSEHANHGRRLPGPHEAPSYKLEFTPRRTPAELIGREDAPKVAILRAKGSNGDREMAAACLAGGLLPFDVNMDDLREGRVTLDEFQGVIFVGGFSYMDVFESAKGWAAEILFNKKLWAMFERFYDRPDTFSLGVCNGCQAMALLGVLFRGLDPVKQPRFVHNKSKKFESRLPQTKILPENPAIMLRKMSGSSLPISSQHGEGYCRVEQELLNEIERQNLAPIRYVDPLNNITEEYPYNPNGSPRGIAALCSPDGRHLAMMPHPERCFRLEQLAWKPAPWYNLEMGPWIQMFQNARDWCLEQREIFGTFGKN